MSQGFIYLVNVTGVTGMRSSVNTRVSSILKDTRNFTTKAIGVGFGVSQMEQGRQVKEWSVYAVIVGSAFVNRLASGNPQQGLSEIAEFCRNLKASITTN